MPMSSAFMNRITPVLKNITDHYGTPFHIYDEQGLRDTGQNLVDAFSGINSFKEYFGCCSFLA